MLYFSFLKTYVGSLEVGTIKLPLTVKNVRKILKKGHIILEDSIEIREVINKIRLKK